MPLVRAGFGDSVYQAAGMKAVAGGQNAGLDAEFSQSVWERERHVDVRKAVIVIAAIQQVVCGVACAAGDCNRVRGIEAFV